jgi:hypothetical protein
MRIQNSTMTCAWLLTIGLVTSCFAQKADQARAEGREDFFIVSSVDTAKNQFLLKHPTEVTELILVNDKTTYLDEQGKRLRFKDFRAGDTVYVISTRANAGGARLATRVRKASMTLEELRRRYLKQ